MYSSLKFVKLSWVEQRINLKFSLKLDSNSSLLLEYGRKYALTIYCGEH